MKKRYGTRLRKTLFGMLLLVAALYIPAEIAALSFDEVTAHMNAAPAVKAAQWNRYEAEDRLLLSMFPGDPELTLTPATSFETAEGNAFTDVTTIGATAALSIPIALSQDRRVAVDAASMALSRARTTEIHARAEVYATLLNAYRRAWLAQRELEVLQRELEALSEVARVTNERYRRGAASLQEVNDAEDDLVRARTALREGTLARRLRSLELLYAAGLERSRTDDLQPLTVVLPDIPRPPELTEWAVEHDPRIVALNDDATLFSLEETALDGPVGMPTFRAGFSGWDQSASLTVMTENPALSLSYTLPVASYGEIPESRSGASNEETWELSFSLALPLQTTKDRRINSEILTTNRAQAVVAREEIERELALAIRSQYQKLELSRETIADAQRSVEATLEILNTVTGRLAEDRATTADLLLAEAQYHRALYRLDAALAEREEAKILTAAAATYLHVLLGTLDQ